MGTSDGIVEHALSMLDLNLFARASGKEVVLKMQNGNGVLILAERDVKIDSIPENQR